MLTPAQRQLLRNIAMDDGQLSYHQMKDDENSVTFFAGRRTTDISHDGEKYILETPFGDTRFDTPKAVVMRAVQFLVDGE